MTVVSDTSSIRYLVVIEAIEILPNLFDQVFIPQAVYEELTAEGSPEQPLSIAPISINLLIHLAD